MAGTHNDTGEDNADSHLKRQVMGREVVVAITDGKLDFGPGRVHGAASAASVGAGHARPARSRTHCFADTVSRAGEQIFYGEFDGGRRKRVLVKIIGD